MHMLKVSEAPVNRRGGQESFLMLTKGQFGSHHLTVTWVEGGPGSEQPVHAHEQEQVYLVISGRGIMLVGDEEQDVEAGTLIFVPPGSRHCIRNPGPETLVFVSAAAPAIDVNALDEVFQYRDQ